MRFKFILIFLVVTIASWSTQSVTIPELQEISLEFQIALQLVEEGRIILQTEVSGLKLDLIDSLNTEKNLKRESRDLKLDAIKLRQDLTLAEQQKENLIISFDAYKARILIEAQKIELKLKVQSGILVIAGVIIVAETLVIILLK